MFALGCCRTSVRQSLCTRNYLDAAGRDHGDEAQAEDHEPPDRPAEGGDLGEGGGARARTVGASARGEGEGRPARGAGAHAPPGGRQRRAHGRAGRRAEQADEDHRRGGRRARAAAQGAHAGRCAEERVGGVGCRRSSLSSVMSCPLKGIDTSRLGGGVSEQVVWVRELSNNSLLSLLLSCPLKGAHVCHLTRLFLF